MRTFFIFLIVWMSVTVMAQTKLDTILFNKINEYRVSKGLKELKWDSCGYRAVDHHTLYLVSHSYNSPSRYIKMIEQLKKEIGNGTGTRVMVVQSTNSPHVEDSVIFCHFYDRYKYYGGRNEIRGGEVIAGTNRCIKDGDSLIYEKLATDILESWKHSPGHNSILLTPKGLYGAGSTGIEVMDQGIKGYKLYFTTSTFIVI